MRHVNLTMTGRTNSFWSADATTRGRMASHTDNAMTTIQLSRYDTTRLTPFGWLIVEKGSYPDRILRFLHRCTHR